MSSPRHAPETCAHCGAALPRHARACPECGADERTGWREVSTHDGLDLPDGGYDADAPVPPPTMGRPPGWRHPLKWYSLAAALLLLIVLALCALRLW